MLQKLIIYIKIWVYIKIELLILILLHPTNLFFPGLSNSVSAFSLQQPMKRIVLLINKSLFHI